tara:strand:- start:165965 stop:167005 length:1041 start_codon:yes stop_codon:yes gene_type:complete
MRSRRFETAAPPARQRGAALVVAMLVFALCTALVVAMKSELNRVYQRGSNLFRGEQAYAYLRGAEQLAGMALLLDYDQGNADKPRDDLTEIWAQPTAPYALDEGGWLMGSLEDLQGRFNLNRLAGVAPDGDQPGQSRYTPAQEQFIRLLQTFEEPQLSEPEAIAVTESIGDWLDRDINARFQGAEDDFYYSRTPAYRAANQPLASVSELLAVANVTPGIYQALRPLVTAWPQDPAPLNIHTAPVQVLRSINSDGNLSPLSEADGLLLAEQRESTGFTDMDDFLGNAVFAGQQQLDKVRSLLGEDSSYFLLRAEVEVADRNRRLYSVLERRARRITAIVRSSDSGSL